MLWERADTRPWTVLQEKGGELRGAGEIESGRISLPQEEMWAAMLMMIMVMWPVLEWRKRLAGSGVAGDSGER